MYYSCNGELLLASGGGYWVFRQFVAFWGCCYYWELSCGGIIIWGRVEYQLTTLIPGWYFIHLHLNCMRGNFLCVVCTTSFCYRTSLLPRWYHLGSNHRTKMISYHPGYRISEIMRPSIENFNSRPKKYWCWWKKNEEGGGINFSKCWKLNSKSRGNVLPLWSPCSKSKGCKVETSNGRKCQKELLAPRRPWRKPSSFFPARVVTVVKTRGCERLVAGGPWKGGRGALELGRGRTQDNCAIPPSQFI